MIRPRKVACLFLVAVVFSWHVPTCVVGQEDPSATAKIVPVSIALGADGVLHGQALDKQNRPAAGRTVVLGKKGKPIAKAVADSQGMFVFKRLKPGDYQIATSEAAAFLNCHSFEAAPQNAVKRILLSQQSMIARGQQPARVLLHPLFIGLVIAAAIVIPLAVSANDDAS